MQTFIGDGDLTKDKKIVINHEIDLPILGTLSCTIFFSMYTHICLQSEHGWTAWN